MKCAVCGKHEFPEMDSFDICPLCGWEDDGVQNDDHNYAGGANSLSVNEARIEFFLLTNESTKVAAEECKKVYGEKCRAIYTRYAGLHRVKEPEKAKEEKADFRAVRKKYMDELNNILQCTGGFS